MIKHSRIKRALDDRREHSLHPFWIISSYTVTAIIAGLITILPQKYTNLEVFFITFIGGVLGPILIWITLFLFRLFFPIKRFSVSVGNLNNFGDYKNPITYFGITSQSEDLGVGSLKIKFVLPDGSIYDWKDVSHKTFLGSERVFLVEIPEDLRLIEGIYVLKIKSTTWGFPHLFITENKFIYKNKDWDIVKD